MSQQTMTPDPRAGILHQYSPGLVAFEYKSPTSNKPKPNSLLFIAGLRDGLGTVPYLNNLVQALEPTNWAVFAVLLSSSYGGWGTSSLDKDVEEIAKCVDYVNGIKNQQGQDSNSLNGPGLVVLMGHSTGSQDVLHYLYTPNPIHSSDISSAEVPVKKRLPIDGAILQAPVSDREALLALLETGTIRDSPETVSEIYHELVDIAKSNLKEEDNGYLLPPAMASRIGFSNVALSSKRFLSLASPDSPEEPLEDDLFSSDLEEKRLRETFGMVGKNGLLKKSMLVLPGGADEYLPEWVDLEALIGRWATATKDGSQSSSIWDENSGVVPGARHSPQGKWQEKPLQDLISRVQRFLANLEK